MLRLKVSNLIRICARFIFHPPLRVMISQEISGVLIFFVKSVRAFHGTESCFELCAAQFKPTNKTCNFEPRNSYKKSRISGFSKVPLEFHWGSGSRFSGFFMVSGQDSIRIHGPGFPVYPVFLVQFKKLGVCVPRPSAIGPYPRPSTLGPSALGPSSRWPWTPKILQEEIYE